MILDIAFAACAVVLLVAIVDALGRCRRSWRAWMAVREADRQ